MLARLASYVLESPPRSTSCSHDTTPFDLLKYPAPHTHSVSRCAPLCRVVAPGPCLTEQSSHSVSKPATSLNFPMSQDSQVAPTHHQGRIKQRPDPWESVMPVWSRVCAILGRTSPCITGAALTACVHTQWLSRQQLRVVRRPETGLTVALCQQRVWYCPFAELSACSACSCSISSQLVGPFHSLLTIYSTSTRISRIADAGSHWDPGIRLGTATTTKCNFQ